MGKPRGSSKSWRQRQESDPYVRQARRDGKRSRAAFKLEQLLRPGDVPRGSAGVCVDLGAAPGGWSQWMRDRLGPEGRVIALDLLAMDPLPGVEFLQGDFRDHATLRELDTLLADSHVDLVLSDMAPNISGNKSTDQPRTMHLAELAFDFADEYLRQGGMLVCKVFQGEGFEAMVKRSRHAFKEVRVRKPPASRDSSPEVYVLARNYRLV